DRPGREDYPPRRDTDRRGQEYYRLPDQSGLLGCHHRRHPGPAPVLGISPEDLALSWSRYRVPVGNGTVYLFPVPPTEGVLQWTIVDIPVAAACSKTRRRPSLLWR